MKKLFTIIISSLLLLSSVLTSCETVEQTKVGTIYGVVTSENSTEPLSAVSVALYRINSSNYKDYSLLYQTVTYNDGHFEFSNLNAGYYLIKIDALGYEEAEYEVVVGYEHTARADMRLKLLETELRVVTKDPVLSNGVVKLSMSFTYDTGYSNQWNECLEAGFYYSKSVNPAISGTKIKINHSNSIYELRDLESGVYYIVAYAINSYGISLGDVKTFTYKLQPIMSVKLLKVTSSTASFTCHIDNMDKITIEERGFIYSSSFSNPTVEDPNSETIKRVTSGDSEDFSLNVANLFSNCRYYLRAYVKLSSGVYYSKVISFMASDNYISEFELGGRIYQVSPDQGAFTWKNAISTCSSLVYGGYSDWVLPDLNTLDAMYENKDIIGGFSPTFYWSSSAPNSSLLALQKVY